MLRRPYGPSKLPVSAIVFGGIVVKDLPQERANAVVRRAFDRGVNYFDVAPTYGTPEALLGPALAELPRSEVFLACKTTKRDAAGARAELENSLKTLQVEHLDLYQFHAVGSQADVDRILAPGGALETFVRAKERGRVRHLGFSAHDEDAGLRLLEAYPFDSALFPVNWVSLCADVFGRRLLEACKAKGVSALALKAMARCAWSGTRDPRYPFLWYQPETDPELAALALRYTLAQGVTAAVPPGHEELFWRAVDVAERYRAPDGEELRRLEARAEELTPLFPVPPKA
ncbi:MAG: aldo/keto reductase [Planctomycetota bacterium]|nr:aldo/keto reductase [Planctomycetota bacterium]